MILEDRPINGQGRNDGRINIGTFGDGHSHPPLTWAAHDTWETTLASGYLQLGIHGIGGQMQSAAFFIKKVQFG
jgi:hypothetical protein